MNTETNPQTTIISRSNACLLENYGRLPIAIERAKGSEFFDTDGKRYIDLFSGFGAGGLLGHSHPAVCAAIQKQSDKVISHGNLFTSLPQIELAERLTADLPGARVFFCHSGAEAAEAAIKLARKANADRHKIICFNNCFHGRTMGALSLCPESFQLGFEPILDGVLRAEYNNLHSVESLIDEQTAAVFLEPIQGEGGVVVPSIEFVQGLRKLCDENNLLLVCDEVWTAPGRTGKFYAHQHFNITPDVITMAKALGGGLPIAACIISEKWSNVLGPGTHGCTLGGNPLCASAAVAALAVMDQEKLIDRAIELGEYCQTFFSELDDPGICSIRGKGLMLGIELKPELEAAKVMRACIEQGIFVASAKQNVLRIAPALNIEQELLADGLTIIGNALASFR